MARPIRTRRRPGWRIFSRLGGIGRKRALSLACISALAVFIAANAGLSAFANAVRAQNPALIASLTDDPLAPLLAVERQIGASPRRILGNDVETLIRESLRREAINTAALRTFALRAEATRDRQAAVTFARLAERSSRRDLVTQLVLIELAVQANSPELALRHYDKALRTSGEARSILFPVLSSAIASDVIRRAFVPYVQRRAYWIPDFVQHSMRSGEAGPRETAKLLILAGAGNQEELMRASAPLLIEALVDRGEVSLAQRLFLQMPGTNPRFLQDTGFTSGTTNAAYGLLAWTPVSNGSAGAAFDGPPDSSRRSARLFASSGERGILLRRVVGLPPGHYYLSERRSRAAGDASSRAYWEMKCFINGRPQSIWRGPSDRAIYNLSRAPGPVVPAGCTNQLLELNVAAGDGREGLEFVIEQFSLAR